MVIKVDQIEPNPQILVAQASPPAVSTGKGAFYPVTVSGFAEGMYEDDHGNVTQITNQGALNVPPPASSANPALSNLTATSINQSLIPAAAGTKVLGSATDYWGPSFVSQFGDTSSMLSVDIFNRKLYFTDGTTVMLDWSAAGVISVNSNKIDNLADPTTTQGAATKHYVDTAISGLSYANLSLSNLTTTSINQSLIPASAGSQVLGSAADYWGPSFVSQFDDTSSVLSIDVFNRGLFNTSGNPAFNWGTVGFLNAELNILVNALSNTRAATASPDGVTTSDYFVGAFNASAPAVENLPPGLNGLEFVVMDTSGQGATNNITINPSGSDEIATTNPNPDVITTAFGYRRYIYQSGFWYTVGSA